MVRNRRDCGKEVGGSKGREKHKADEVYEARLKRLNVASSRKEGHADQGTKCGSESLNVRKWGDEKALSRAVRGAEWLSAQVESGAKGAETMGNSKMTLSMRRETKTANREMPSEVETK